MTRSRAAGRSRRVGGCNGDVPPVLETIIGPGEAVFLPVGWWHHVAALDLG